MDIVTRLQQIEDLLAEAKSMPLSSSVLVNREEVLDLLRQAREDLPDELERARWVLRDREDLLAKARREAEDIVEQAGADRARLVAREEVVVAAGEEADRILAAATHRARELRLEAEDYVDAKLAQFEIALNRTRQEIERSIAQVQRGREKLRGDALSAAEEEFGRPEDEDEGA